MAIPLTRTAADKGERRRREPQGSRRALPSADECSEERRCASRTLIARLGSEVERELGHLDARLARIARRYIRRLGLEPRLGGHADRGLPAEYGCRRSRFDSHDLQPGGRSPKRHLPIH